MYTVIPTRSFDQAYISLTKKNATLKRRTIKTIQLLAENPRHPSLHSHKVVSRKYGEMWSSRVTADIRIIWNYNSKEIQVIDLYDIGGHTGTHKVYK